MLRPYAELVLCLLLVAPPLAAQVDPSGRWETWHSQHFRVHAKATDADLAERAAREAERAYTLLATELVPPRGTIDLVVADNVDVANGYATMFPSNRLTVFAVPPVESPALAVYDDWLRLVLTHELTHLFHLDRSRGLWRTLQSVFGRAPALFPNAYQPSWVKEGLATRYESHLTAAGRVSGSYHRAILTAAAVDGPWIRPWDAGIVSPRWPAGLRPYAWGGEFFGLEAEQWGDSVAPRFVERSAGQLWPFAVSRPLRKAGGSGVREGWRALRVDATRRADERKSPPIVARGLRSEPHPRLSQDGRRLAFVRDDGVSTPEVAVVDAASWEETARRRVTGVADIAWVGPDLAVTQLDFTSPVDLRSDLYRWAPGHRWQRVSHGGRLIAPFDVGDGRIGAIDIGRGAAVALEGVGAGAGALALPEGDAWQRIAVSPDGHMIAGTRHRDGWWDVVVWTRGAPASPRALTHDPWLDRDPAWDRSGTRLLFASEREGISQIYAVSVSDGVVVRLTNVPGGAWEPTPMPDGSLVCTTLLGDGYALVHVPASQNAPAPSESRTGMEPSPPPAIALQESGYSPWPALRPRYWLPFGHDEGDAGVFVGAFTSGVDPIERTAYAGWVAASLEPARVEGWLGVSYSRWKRFALDVSAGQTWDGSRGLLASGTTASLAERQRDAQLGVTWSWRRWRSGIAARVGVTLEDDDWFVDRPSGVTLSDSPTFAGAGVSLRAAYVQRPALAISPENGGRVELGYRRRWALSGSAWSDETRAAVSSFVGLALPGFAHWVLAGRVSVGWTGGPAAELLELGGVSGRPVAVLGTVPLGSGRRRFALRGYPALEAFTRATTGVLELRAPIALVGRGMPIIPILLDRVSVSVFGEVGGGWQAGDVASPTRYRDVGGELVLDLGLLTDYAVRLRAGVAVPLVDGLSVSSGHVRGYLAFGTSFD